MRLRVLGCSGGVGGGLRTSCYLLDRSILLDCGTGIGILPREEMCDLKHVFLTHSHLDHVGGLPLLVDTMFDCVEAPLRVHGQAATIRALQDHLLNWTIWPDFAELPTKHDPVLAYDEIEPGGRVEVEGAVFESIPVDHVVPCTAYVVHKGGRTFCFTGDTTTNDGLWEALNRLERLDFLLVECAFPDRLTELARLAKHYTPSLLVEDLEKLEHRPRIAVTHMKPGGEDAMWDELQAAGLDRELIRVRHGDVFEI